MYNVLVIPYYLTARDVKNDRVKYNTLLFMGKIYDVGDTKRTITKTGEVVYVSLLPLTVHIMDDINVNELCVPITRCQVLNYVSVQEVSYPFYVFHPDGKDPIKVFTEPQFKEKLKEGYFRFIADVYDLDYEYIVEKQLVGTSVKVFNSMVNSGYSAWLIEKESDMVKTNKHELDNFKKQDWLEAKKVLFSLILNSNDLDEFKMKFAEELYESDNKSLEAFSGYEALTDDIPFESV